MAVNTQKIGVRWVADRKCWCVSCDGEVRGDARGYNRDDAVAEAKKRVASDPEYRVLERTLRM